ncbi:hypothetical protein IW148_005673 [Coemansia sp. RSA 1199]|nr:hypothetical protein IW148_005673 [Coemansia sp. RSA 1199]
MKVFAIAAATIATIAVVRAQAIGDAESTSVSDSEVEESDVSDVSEEKKSSSDSELESLDSDSEADSEASESDEDSESSGASKVFLGPAAVAALAIASLF